ELFLMPVIVGGGKRGLPSDAFLRLELVQERRLGGFPAVPHRELSPLKAGVTPWGRRSHPAARPLPVSGRSCEARNPRSMGHLPSSLDAQSVNEVYRAAATSLEFMSMVMVHPEVPRNSNGAGLGPRR